MPDPKSPSDATSELDASARLRVRVGGLAAGLVAAVLVLLAGAAPRQALFDAWQRLAPAPDVSRRVHVVVIDADSLRAVGGWPWSRFYLARLVEQIADRGAEAIGFDMLLQEPDRLEPAQFAGLYTELPPAAAADIARLPSMDAVFARVIGRTPVVLARAGVRPGAFDFASRAAQPLPPQTRFAGTPPDRMLDFPGVLANHPILDGAPLGHGLINGDRDADGVLRRVPLVARAGGELTPGLALELVRVAEGARRIDLIGRNGALEAVQAGRRRVAATPDGQMLLRFADWRRTQTTSAVNLLRQGLPKDLFKGQIVLIGLASVGASDVISTPRDHAVYSVFIQAEAVDAILRGEALVRPDWAAPVEAGVGLLLVLAAWFGVPRLPMAAVCAMAAAEVAVAFGASWLAFQRDVLVDPYPALAPGAATAAAMVALLFVEGRRAQVRLRAVIEDQRRRAEDHQRLLINELNHRVKNTLATVQSIALQTNRNIRDPAQFMGAFLARIGALAQAHELLSEASWDGASLAEVITRTLAPHLPGDRVCVSGPPVRLGPNAAVTLNMAFHELATNAAKFGALAASDGRVEVTWRLENETEPTMVIDWRETGGPPVSQPDRRGFGMRLIERALAREFGGEVSVTFAPEGLRCHMRLPLSTRMRLAS